MKIEITKNRRDLIASMNSRVLAAQEDLKRCQSALNDELVCHALDAGGVKGAKYERFILHEEDGKFSLTLCEPESQIADPHPNG
jgi:hypothetical protein